MSDWAERHIDFMENHIREVVRDSANELRRRADEMDRVAAYKDVTQVPGIAMQTLVNTISNLRIDLPAVWLGNLIETERADLKRGSSGND